MALPPAEVIAHDEIRAAVKAYEEAKARRWAAWQAMTAIADTRDAALLDVVAESPIEDGRGRVISRLRALRALVGAPDRPRGRRGISTLRGAYAPAVEVEEPTAA